MQNQALKSSPHWLKAAVLCLMLFGVNCSGPVRMVTPENAFVAFECFGVTLPSKDWRISNHQSDRVEVMKNDGNGKYEMGYRLLVGNPDALGKKGIKSSKDYITDLLNKEANEQKSRAKGYAVKQERVAMYSDDRFYYGVKTTSESKNRIKVTYLHFVVPGKAESMKLIQCHYQETREKSENNKRVTDEYLKSIMTIKINQECFVEGPGLKV